MAASTELTESPQSASSGLEGPPRPSCSPGWGSQTIQSCELIIKNQDRFLGKCGFCL